MRKLGFVGLGNIGKGVCNRLIETGNQLIVYDIDDGAMERFNGRAAQASSTSEVLEKSDIVFLSLPNSNIVENVMDQFFSTGVQGKVVIDMSTSYPLSTKEIYKKMNSQGGVFLDVPIMAGPAEAETGQGEIIIGGDKGEADKLKDLFNLISKKNTYIGESGSAHLMKLALNFCGLSLSLIYAQIFPVMAKMGIDTKDFFRALDVEGRTTWELTFYGGKFRDRNYNLDFALELGTKDLAYMKRLYEDLNIPAFILDGALDMCRMALANQKQGETLDFSTPAEMIYKMLDV